MSAVRTWFLGAALSLGASAQAAVDPVTEANEAYAKAYGLYVTLHQHPELSGAELQTSAKLAAELRALGYGVTEHVGGTGLVAVLANGAGNTVMLRPGKTVSLAMICAGVAWRFRICSAAASLAARRRCSLAVISETVKNVANCSSIK